MEDTEDKHIMSAQEHRFASLSENSITSRLGDVKARVLELGERLEGQLHGRAAGVLNSLLDDLKAHSCRVAVIGQMKAGKSTLINALMQRPGMLPTDVNPSTAVITKLHFGAPPEKANTALFQFFSEEEWDRIMSGGRANAMSTDRQLTYKPDRLAKPLEELQRRAEQRLGSDYTENLGKHHLLSSVTTGTLERYVSAGDYVSEDEPDDDTRFFSDITKTADVFLEGQPLGYPAVIIDTPGVNDPFLVREEITHGYLGEADVYLVVLTAQQPLSQSDLALLRMLKGLQKDRIIMVVNRIDLADGLAEQSDKITAHIQATLKREFPHADIPVILASAYWANSALSGDEEELADALTPSLAAYADKLAKLGENPFGRPAADWSTEQVEQMLYQISGIPALISAVERLIGHSVTAERLLPVSSTLGAVADNTVIALRYGTRSLENASSSGAPDEETWFRANALKNLQKLELVSSRIEADMEITRTDLARMTREELDRLRKHVDHAISEFAKSEENTLIQLGSYAPMKDGFQQRSSQFRSQLAEDFYKYFTELAKQLQSRQQKSEAILRQSVKDALPDLDDVLHFGVQGAELPAPSIVPLSKLTALDTDDFWQHRIAARVDTTDPAEASQFQNAIVSIYAELIDELFSLAQETLNQHAKEALRRLQFLSYSAIYPIAQQLQRWVEIHKLMKRDKRGGSFCGQLLATSRDQLHGCVELADNAANLRQQCLQMMET
ncbi:MAG: dynamin family protein [Alphaproteobacteria bacterium]